MIILPKTHQLIKLRVSTVDDLKRLKSDMGIANLDGLINVMIRLAEEHRLVYQNTGWQTALNTNENVL